MAALLWGLQLQGLDARRACCNPCSFFSPGVKMVCAKVVLAALMLAACGWSSATEAPVKSNGALPVIAAPRSLAPDGSHFLSASGTPVLWLADTWWFCPSTLCPIDGSSNAAIPSMFKALVDQRAKQGFNVIQVAFQGPAAPGLGGVGGLYARQGNEQDRARVWQSARQYVQYANSRGLAVAIAASFHSGLDGLSLQQLQEMWKDLVEALGEFEVIWLIAGEYNLLPPEGRLAKVDALAHYIRSIDKHQRLLTVHPAGWKRNAPTLAHAGWMDFIMIQAGHGPLPPVATYQPAQRRGKVVPVVESECRYEAIHGRVRHRCASVWRAPFRPEPSDSATEHTGFGTPHKVPPMPHFRTMARPDRGGKP